MELINSAWLLSEKVVRFFLSFVVTLLIARYLLPAQFGIFSSFIALIGMLAPISQMGLSGILIQQLVKAEHNAEQTTRILQSAVLLRLAGGIFLCLFVLMPTLIWVARIDGYRLELTVLFIANVFSCLGVYEAYFKAQRNERINALIQAFVLLVAGALKVISVFSFPDKQTLLSILLMITAVELLATPLTTYVIWQKKYRMYQINRVSLTTVKSLWRDSKWLLFSGAAAVFYIKTDVVMVIWLLDDYSAGIYGAASRFTEVWFFLAPLLMNVFLPKLQQQFQHDVLGFKRLIRWLSLLMLSVALVIAVVTVLFSHSMIHVTLGDAFNASSAVLVWHVWLLPLVFFRAVISSWLIINEYYRFSLISHTLGAITNIGLNLILIPSFGLIGAVVASWTAFFVATFLAMLLNKSTRAFFTDLFSFDKSID